MVKLRNSPFPWTVIAALIATLDLHVPTHSDRAGGLGFLERTPKAFSLFAFALSAVLASRLAHDVVYHGVHVMSLKLEVVIFLIFLVMLCLMPLMVFIPILATAKWRCTDHWNNWRVKCPLT